MVGSLARALRRGSDAATTLSLNYSVARALLLNPTGVLRLIHHGFSVDDVCTSPFIEPKPGVAEEYQQRAIEVLHEPVRTELEAARKECLERIREPLRPDHGQ